LPSKIATSLIAIGIGILFAVVIAHVAERIYSVKDDSRIVIDEWIGTWIAAWGLEHHFGFAVMAAFILFRVFDVYKGPWGNRLQYLPGGWGVVMDDVLAGFIANFFARIVVVIVGVL
jgi:phosphatidylglycerophosphatase A